MAKNPELRIGIGVDPVIDTSEFRTQLQQALGDDNKLTHKVKVQLDESFGKDLGNQIQSQLKQVNKVLDKQLSVFAEKVNAMNQAASTLFSDAAISNNVGTITETTNETTRSLSVLTEYIDKVIDATANARGNNTTFRGLVTSANDVVSQFQKIESIIYQIQKANAAGDTGKIDSLVAQYQSEIEKFLEIAGRMDAYGANEKKLTDLGIDPVVFRECATAAQVFAGDLQELIDVGADDDSIVALIKDVQKLRDLFWTTTSKETTITKPAKDVDIETVVKDYEAELSAKTEALKTNMAALADSQVQLNTVKQATLNLETSIADQVKQSLSGMTSEIKQFQELAASEEAILNGTVDEKTKLKNAFGASTVEPTPVATAPVEETKVETSKSSESLKLPTFDDSKVTAYKQALADLGDEFKSVADNGAHDFTEEIKNQKGALDDALTVLKNYVTEAGKIKPISKSNVQPLAQVETPKVEAKPVEVPTVVEPKVETPKVTKSTKSAKAVELPTFDTQSIKDYEGELDSLGGKLQEVADNQVQHFTDKIGEQKQSIDDASGSLNGYIEKAGQIESVPESIKAPVTEPVQEVKVVPEPQPVQEVSPVQEVTTPKLSLPSDKSFKTAITNMQDYEQELGTAGNALQYFNQQAETVTNTVDKQGASLEDVAAKARDYVSAIDVQYLNADQTTKDAVQKLRELISLSEDKKYTDDVDRYLSDEKQIEKIKEELLAMLGFSTSSESGASKAVEAIGDAAEKSEKKVETLQQKVKEATTSAAAPQSTVNATETTKSADSLTQEKINDKYSKLMKQRQDVAKQQDKVNAANVKTYESENAELDKQKAKLDELKKIWPQLSEKQQKAYNDLDKRLTASSEGKQSDWINRALTNIENNKKTLETAKETLNRSSLGNINSENDQLNFDNAIKSTDNLLTALEKVRSVLNSFTGSTKDVNDQLKSWAKSDDGTKLLNGLGIDPTKIATSKDALNELRLAMAQVTAENKKMSDALKDNALGQQNQLALSNLNNEFQAYLDKNTKILSSSMKPQADALAAKLGNPENASNIANLKLEVSQFKGEANAAGLETDSLSTKISNLFSQHGGTMLVMSALHALQRALRQVYTNVVEIDDALTQLKIVTNANTTAMKEYADSAAAAAKEVSASITDILTSTTTYARLGFSGEDSVELAKYTAMYSNTSGSTVDDATTAVTAILKGYNKDVDDVEQMLSELVKVGENCCPTAQRCVA